MQSIHAKPYPAPAGATRLNEPVPPIMQLAGRISAAMAHFSERADTVIQAGHRTADRITGERGPEVAHDEPMRPEPAALGVGGQMAELEVAVVVLERQLYDWGTNLERMINRVTQIG